MLKIGSIILYISVGMHINRTSCDKRAYKKFDKRSGFVWLKVCTCRLVHLNLHSQVIDGENSHHNAIIRPAPSQPPKQSTWSECSTWMEFLAGACTAPLSLSDSNKFKSLLCLSTFISSYPSPGCSRHCWRVTIKITLEHHRLDGERLTASLLTFSLLDLA